MNLEAKKKDFTIPPLVIASLVPIGLYAFSKYKDYDSKKTMKVTIIGSVVILGALVINELSGWGSASNKFSNRLFGLNQDVEKKVLQPFAIENPLPEKKPCKKWTQNVCIEAPCNQTCLEY
jgi:hypothetical protein